MSDSYLEANTDRKNEIIHILSLYHTAMRVTLLSILFREQELLKDGLTDSRRDMIGHSTDKALSEDLWQTTLNTMGTIEMDADFTNSLRGWIALGFSEWFGRIALHLPMLRWLCQYDKV
jgi:hypothetical protein